MVNKEQRRRQLAREKFQRQQDRRVQARSKARQRNAIIAGVLVLVLGGGGAAVAVVNAADDGDGKDAAQESASPTPTTPAKDPCKKPAAGSPSTKTWKKEPAMTVDDKAKYTMALDTTCGEITVEMDAAKTPHTVNSFAFLAEQGYFNHSSCHRLVNYGIYVLQCGDPTGDGSGTPGYNIPDENLDDPAIKNNVYPTGTVAMANRYDASTGQNRNSGGAQFFLVYQDSQLPPDYTPFGKITAGMDVLQKIAKAGTQSGTPDGPPTATVVVNEALVAKKD